MRSCDRNSPHVQKLIKQPVPSPSEVVRIAAGDQWRDYMSTVRDLALQLTMQGIADITQKGSSVGPPFIGLIRIRRGPMFPCLTREALQAMMAKCER